MTREPRRFPHACVASPHHLATASGARVLARGGNAMDAAVAASVTLSVVTPYHCGPGGDLFAIVWAGGGLHAYNGSGRAPAGATLGAVRAAAGDPPSRRLPSLGPLSVTVPGAVEAWHALLARFGTMPFAEVARDAIAHATDGFVVSAHAMTLFGPAQRLYADEHWRAVYGDVRAHGTLRQPGLALTLEAVAAEGPRAFYTGEIARAIAGRVTELGGMLTTDDLAKHVGCSVTPLTTTFAGLEIAELPPNTQGVTALEALAIVDEAGLGPAGAGREHLMIEAVKLALADREQVTDPGYMNTDPRGLASREHARDRLSSIDPVRAAAPSSASRHGGGTAYLCAADRTMLAGLIQSNYQLFGSGITVPVWGINLHNRGSSFSLDPAHPNAIAPGKRPMHTLIPAMALRDGAPVCVFGTMGADGQAQTHLQLLAHAAGDGTGWQDAIDAPRWRVSVTGDRVWAEDRFPNEVLDGLRDRGHAVEVVGSFDHRMGHANAIAVEAGRFAGATDPRTEGSAEGW